MRPVEDKFSAQITRLESELAEAREALRKADEAIVEYHTEYDAISKWYSCIFCSDAQSEPEDIEHTGDCPVTTARARLAPGELKLAAMLGIAGGALK